MSSRKPCALNLFVDYDKEEKSENCESACKQSLGLFKGDAIKDYPFTAPHQGLNEQNFTNVENQIERVDFNFFDEYLLGSQQQITRSECSNIDNYESIVKEVQMQEKDAFNLYNRIFSEEN